MTEPSSIPESAVRHTISPKAFEQMLKIVGNVVSGLARCAEPGSAAPVLVESAASDVAASGVTSPSPSLEPFEAPRVKRDLESLLHSAKGGRGFFEWSEQPFVALVRPPAANPDGDVLETEDSGSWARVALTVVGVAGLDGLDVSKGDESALIDGSRRLICRGAVPVGAVLIASEGAVAGDQGETFAVQCAALEMAGFCGGSAEPSWALGHNGAVRRLLVFGWVGDSALETRPTFQKEGDAILLLGEPVERGRALQGLGRSRWWLEVRGNEPGAIAGQTLEEVLAMNDGLRMLLHGGCVRSAIPCATGGLAVALAQACVGGSGTPMGAILDWTGLLGGEIKEGETALRWDALWFGEAAGRVVLTTSPIDAGKVMAQARILGIPAMLIGRTGGDQLHLKTPYGEVSWGMLELRGQTEVSNDAVMNP